MSLVSWAGSTLAAFSLFGGAPALPQLPPPLAPTPAWVPHQSPQMGAAPQPNPTQPQPLPPLNPIQSLANLHLEGASNLTREELARERFNNYSKEFKDALSQSNFDRAAQMLAAMVGELDLLRDTMRPRAVAKIMVKATRLLDCLCEAIEKGNGSPLSAGASDLFQRVLDKLEHGEREFYRRVAA